MNNGAELGKCIFCDSRVKNDHLFVVSSDGYVHRNCIFSTKGSSGVVS